MGETSNTMEQRNAGQAVTIGRQAEQIKALKQEVADLAIWQRFVSYLITDCNMQPDVMEESMGQMLANEEAAKKAGPVKK